MIRIILVLLVALIPAACVTGGDSPPPPSGPTPSLVPNREAADRVLNTMKEKVAAAEALVELHEQNAQGLEAEFQAGRGTATGVASAQAEIWEARIRALNYKQELYMAERAGPLVLEAMRDKVAAAERVLQIRERMVGDAEALADAGRESAANLTSMRGQVLEDRIRFLNYRLDLEYAEEIVRMTGEPGDGK